jgi:hypothetical protein
MTKKPGATSDNGFIFKKIMKIKIEKRKKNPVSHFGNNPIYPLLSTWISTWTEP